MKKVTFTVELEVDDAAKPDDLAACMYDAMSNYYVFRPGETCKISLIEDFVEPPPH